MDIFRCKCADGSECGVTDSQLDTVLSELHSGKMVVYPTETVYGLGSDPFDEAAVKRVFMAKRRPFDMPLTIAVSNVRMIDELAIMDDRTRKLAERFLPGPLTLLLQKRSVIPDIVTAAQDEVGIRVPSHPFALRLIDEFGPLISTSANLHSRPNPTTVEACVKDLGNAVSVYVDCGPSPIGKPSTIVQLIEGELEVIRTGAIPVEDIEAVLNG
jgi:L-threonylcarbamoyladenylate synthase